MQQEEFLKQGVVSASTSQDMDKSAKRLSAVNQGSSAGNGSTARVNSAGPGSTVGRAAVSQAPSTSSQFLNNRGTQQRVPSRNSQQNQSRNSAAPSFGGRYGGSAKGGHQPQGLGAFPELGINGVEQGTRKHNYNHLINLSYGHRDAHFGGGRSSHHHYHHLGYHHHQPKYNKEQFLQANCQFVIKEQGEYAVHHVDPDQLVDWNNIEMIKVYSHEELSCPICLHSPVAGKMTRCGHVFCWPCILHYLALSDVKWRKCPICYESVYSTELKSVVTQMTSTVKVDQDITMRLMVCEKATIWPFPVTEWLDRQGIFYNIAEENVSLRFAKFLTIRKDQIAEKILAREEEELLFALQTEEDGAESAFIEEALKELSKRTGNLSSSSSSEVNLPVQPASSVKTTAAPSAGSPVSVAPPVGKKKVYSSAFLDEEVKVSPLPAEVPSGVEAVVSLGGQESEEGRGDSRLVVGEVSPVVGEGSPVVAGGSIVVAGGSTVVGGVKAKGGQASFFYQAADGQHVYLHPFSVKMLLKQYGELSASPVEITARIVEVESWTITEGVRKRYRYLAHLPLTCVINLVELELKPPHVTEDVMHAFEEESQQRQRQRQLKTMHEEKGQRDAENAFRKDIRGRISFSLQSEFFPDVGSSSLPLESLDFASEEAFPAVGAEPVVAVATPSSQPIPSTSASRSFAQTLRQGKKQPQPKQQSHVASTSRGLGPWALDHSGPHLQSDNGSTGEEDHHPAPNFQNSFSASLDAAFSRMNMAEKEAESSGANQQGAVGKGSKKKRTKGTLLFSTGSVPRV